MIPTETAPFSDSWVRAAGFGTALGALIPVLIPVLLVLFCCVEWLVVTVLRLDRDGKGAPRADTGSMLLVRLLSVFRSLRGELQFSATFVSIGYSPSLGFSLLAGGFSGYFRVH